MVKIKLLIFLFLLSITGQAQVYSGYFKCRQLNEFSCLGFPKYEIELNIISEKIYDAPDSIKIFTGDGYARYVSRSNIKNTCGSIKTKYSFFHTYPGCGNFHLKTSFKNINQQYNNTFDSSIIIEEMLVVASKQPFFDISPDFENIQKVVCNKKDSVRINLGLNRKKIDSYFFELIPSNNIYKLPENIAIDNHSGEIIFHGSNDTGNILIYISVKQFNSYMRCIVYIPITVKILDNSTNISQIDYTCNNKVLDKEFPTIFHKINKPLVLRLFYEKNYVDSFKYNLIGDFSKNKDIRLDKYISQNNLICDFEWTPTQTDSLNKTNYITFLLQYFVNGECYNNSICFKSVVVKNSNIDDKMDVNNKLDKNSIIFDLLNGNLKGIHFVNIFDNQGRLIFQGNSIDYLLYSKLSKGMYIFSIYKLNEPPIFIKIVKK